MKEMERNTVFKKRILQPGDPADGESYKVRKGKVGGHREYLNGKDC